MNSVTTAIVAAQVPDSFTTSDGLVIFPSQLYKGCAKLSADLLNAAEATPVTAGVEV